MNKIALFAGTTEGRELAAFFVEQKRSAIVFAATEYGKESLPKGETIQVIANRLSKEAMMDWIKKENITLVIDATHPYAIEVTKNCEAAAKACNIEYQRIIRAASRMEIKNPPQEKLSLHENSMDLESIRVVASCKEAAEFLNRSEERALLTTGSKELAEFTKVTDYKNRLTARVLPTKETLLHCFSLGFEGKNLIAMQGPFSEEMNYLMLMETKSSILVTKEAGQAGGFEEKLRAVKRANAKVIIIQRPSLEEGITVEEMKKKLLQGREA